MNYIQNAQGNFELPNQAGYENQYQMMPQQMSNAPPLSMPSEKADLLDKIQPTKSVDDIYHKLMGEILEDGAWRKVPELQSNALTKKGAHEIATLMLSVSSQNVSLSKLKDNEIRARALSISKTVMRMCIQNWREYGIKKEAQFGFVHDIVFSNTFITLKQSEGEGIRRLLGNTMTAEIAPPEQENQGWGNIFRR